MKVIISPCTAYLRNRLIEHNLHLCDSCDSPHCLCGILTMQPLVQSIAVNVAFETLILLLRESFTVTFLSAVDYPSTTSYYWPDIAENVTQVFGQVKNATKCNSEL